MACMDTGFKDALPSIIDWLLKWTDANKKQIYPNGWQKERPHWTKKTSRKEMPPPKQQQQLQIHNVLTDDVENANRTNAGRDLRFAM